jgi:hypothetical protein
VVIVLAFVVVFSVLVAWTDPTRLFVSFHSNHSDQLHWLALLCISKQRIWSKLVDD